MRHNGFYNYYELDSYCKSERMCTEHLLAEINEHRKKKKIKALLAAVLVRFTGR